MTLFVVGALLILAWVIWSFDQINRECEEMRRELLLDLEIHERGLALTMRRRWGIY